MTNKVCSVKGCGSKHNVSGLGKGGKLYCAKHYYRMSKYNSIEFPKLEGDISDIPYYKKEKEVWKDIKGYKGKYKVSSYGRVKSLQRTVTCGDKLTLRKERILKNSISHGYKLISLCKDGKQKCISSHRLVALNFIKNPKNKLTINHIDGNKLNNYFENLEWNTYKENNDHAVKLGLINNSGDNNSQSKLAEKEVLEIFYSQDSESKLSKRFNIGTTQVNYIRNKKSWINITKNLENNYIPNKSGNSKLTEKEVLEIYKFKISNKDLVKKYKVTLSTICGIKRKAIWKHIHENEDSNDDN